MSFNIFFNSSDGAGDNFNKEFTFDFSFMEDCEYELTFSFLSDNQIQANFTGTKQLFSIAVQNFPLKNNFNSNTLMRNSDTAIIGFVSKNVLIDNNTQYSSLTSNVPVRCMKPTNNSFFVKLLDIDGELLTAFEKYNLALNFKKVKQYI
tara:strand:- start:714 stop:1160 length:447 start_codon:yes stop_codon:yes gene_type:complete